MPPTGRACVKRCEHEDEIATFFEHREPSTECLVALDESQHEVIGFADLSIRSHAEGCLTRGVAYLEGWFVEERHRRRGTGTALVKAAEAWGRARGCREFASDTQLVNDGSIAAHLAIGFEEVERIVCFRKALSMAALLAASALVIGGCAPREASRATSAAGNVDQSLTDYIAGIKAVDNHSHVNSTAPNDSEFDALPLDNVPPFAMPARARPDSPAWFPALRALYGYQHQDLNADHAASLRDSIARVRREHGDKFPEWVLDQAGIEVMLANRVAMGPGLSPTRFRWVSFADALMLPVSTRPEAAATPDRSVLYPLEDNLLHRYMEELHLARLPSTLEDYLRTVVTPTLERQRQAGAVATKFEAAYLRPLSFDDVPQETAARIYSRYIGGGEPTRNEYKALQDFLFRYIAHEAGRIGLAIHIHSFEGAGSFYDVAGSDPLLLESVFDTPALRSTSFVIVHGGGMFASHTAGLLAKPNVFADCSLMALLYTPEALTKVLREWVSQYPEKVLFGTDASGFGPDLGWDAAAWLAASTARQSLAAALTDMIDKGDIDRAGAERIATMVLRTNATRLYKLSLQ
jgi:predicted TIM-barrel fold metal-dependent hydrolase/GNAT superfamily N-acetyltransferase